MNHSVYSNSSNINDYDDSISDEISSLPSLPLNTSHAWQQSNSSSWLSSFFRYGKQLSDSFNSKNNNNLNGGGSNRRGSYYNGYDNESGMRRTPSSSGDSGSDFVLSDNVFGINNSGIDVESGGYDSSAGDIDTIKILVVGDSGVGKTKLIARLCMRGAGDINGMSDGNGDGNGNSLNDDKNDGNQDRSDVDLQNDQIGSGLQWWTIGCKVSVKLYKSQKHESAYSSSMNMYPSNRKHTERRGNQTFVEFWEVGGNHNFELSRNIFYRDLDGIIFVFDLTNRKSFRNINVWLNEIQQVDSELRSSRATSNGIIDPKIKTDSHHQLSSTHMDNGNNQYTNGKRVEERKSSVYNWDMSLSQSPCAATTSIFRERTVSQNKRERNQFLHGLPMILVGNKLDLVSPSNANSFVNSYQRFGVDGIVLTNSMSPFPSHQLDDFFEKVILYRNGILRD